MAPKEYRPPPRAVRNMLPKSVQGWNLRAATLGGDRRVGLLIEVAELGARRRRNLAVAAVAKVTATWSRGSTERERGPKRMMTK